MATMTLRYTRPSGRVIEVEVKGQEYGSDEDVGKRQTVGETLGDMVFVYSLNREKTEMNLQVDNLRDQERADLEWFFGEQNVDMAERWFTVDLPPARMSVLKAGASKDGTSVKAGEYLAGEYVKQDVLRYTVRLLSEKINYMEPIDGYYSTSLRLRVLPGFLPDNAC